MLSNTKLSDLAPSGLDPNTASLVFLGNRDSGIPFRSQKPHFFVELFNFAAICLLIRRQKCRASHFGLQDARQMKALARLARLNQ